jgi:hypothetical protein
MLTAALLLLAYLAGWRYGDRLAARVGDWFHRTIWGPLGLGGLALVAALPLAAQAADTTVVCTQCVKDSTVTLDSVATWEVFTRINYTYRDSLIITPKGPPTAGNDPAGFTVVADVDWRGVTGSSPAPGETHGPWVRYAPGNHGWAVLDSTAPGSPWALEVRTPAGAKQGSGYEHLEVKLPPGTTRVHLRWAVYVPAAYVPPVGGIQKLFHVWGTYDKGRSASLAVPALYGGALTAQLRFQNVRVTGTQPVSFNRSCTRVPRARWVTMEALLDIRAGTGTLWVAGTACGPWTVTYTAKSGATFEKVQLNPTYGGTGTVPANAAIRFSRVRVSAA